MLKINYSDWIPDYSGLPVSVAKCALDPFEIVEFGLVGKVHSGHVAEHVELNPADPGRYLLRAVVKPTLNFRWKINGWGPEAQAHLHIYRRGSSRPVLRRIITCAEGSLAWDGVLTGIDLREDDRVLLPVGTLTVEGGPYMADIQIGTVQPRRLYFDLAPVVIIGAGAAGLSAANTLLEDRNTLVHLLEARNRPGGRAHTVTFPDSEEPIDLGCQWLHNANSNPLLNLGETNIEHDQTSLSLMAGAVVDVACSEILVEYALGASNNDTSVQTALDDAPDDVIEGQLESEDKINAQINANALQLTELKVLVEKLRDWVIPENPELLCEAAYDGEHAKSHQKKHPRFDRMVNDPDALRAAREIYFSTDNWKEDQQFLPLLRMAWIKNEFRNIENRSRQMRGEIIRTLGLSRADRLEARCVRAKASPQILLALGKECELEESIEAFRFTHAEPDEAVGNQAVIGEALVLVPPTDEEIVEENDDIQETNYLPEEGYGERIRRFASSLETRNREKFKVHLNHQVSRITSVSGEGRPTCLILEVTAGEETKQILALASVIAVPTPIIAGVPDHTEPMLAFEPPLELEVRNAFTALPLGHYKKIIFRLNEGSLAQHLDELAQNGIAPVDMMTIHQHEVTQFKERLGLLVTEARQPEPEAELDPEPTPAVHDISLITLHNDIPWKILYRSAKRMLVFFCGGKRARELDSESVDIAAAEAKLVLQAALGDDWQAAINRDLNGTALTSNWSADRYSQGAYSYMNVGGAGSRELLYSTCLHQRLVFAGEALWPDPHGTAHGAWYSGIRAARFLLDNMKQGEQAL
jgi:monoamine oxidase